MSTALTQPALGLKEQEYIDQVIARFSGRPGALLSILEQVQDHHPSKYLSREVLDYVAMKTETPSAQVYSVVTFYALFNLEPQGEHTICICRGTACHTRGSRALLERVKIELGLDEQREEGSSDKLSMTTRDRKFTVRTVACFGQCALAPVVEFDHIIHSHMNERTLEREVAQLERGREK